ncbi:DinB family protein [Paenibacillus thermotolerans]|uniref:DinB family protein n=1 Tax=Paenibacillus thermotolerans TaxID=3027807 RepID=UPI0023678001|nr:MULTISPECIES: DinB family protein [unclassified Paenibacillus]
MQRPATNEYQSYFATYVNLVPDGEIGDILAGQREEVVSLFRSIAEERGDYRYQPDKWSIKQVLGHMMDTERVMAYRLMCVARGETVSLPGFDENVYMSGAGFERRTLQSLIEEYSAVRGATLALVANVPEEGWTRLGNANNSVVSARALAYIIAGHERHHMGVLKERYSV